MFPCNFNPSAEDTADFIVRYSSRSPEALFEMAGSQCVNFVSREYAVIHLPLEEALPLSLDSSPYSSIPKLYGLLDTTALEASGIPEAARQPAIQATGRGVIIGFIDTGIDYANPLFRRSDGSTRILDIWDQTIQGDAPPEAVAGFQPFFGTVYGQEDIDRALKSEDPYQVVPSRDTDGHGTFMAGVAAGSPVSQPAEFYGAAPDASIAVVKLKPAKTYLRDFFLIPEGAAAYQENDIMAAVSWLLGIANRYALPLVIYLGLGTAQGGHDGTAPLPTMFQSLTSTMGLSVVAGAGNEAGFHHHYLGQLVDDQEYDDVELRIAQDDPGFCVELWAREPELYTVGFVSPSGEIIERIPLVLGHETQIPFRFDSTSISLSYDPYESESGSQLIFMRFLTPAPGIWHIRVYPNLLTARQFHMWLPMHTFVSEGTIFLRSDPDTTITDPGNASMPLTVSTYNHQNNSIYIHSSRGLTRSGQQKPDLAAPGVQVQGPGTIPSRSGTAGRPALSPREISAVPAMTQEEPVLTRRTGSSVAAAIAAGAVAGLFSWGITDGNDRTLTSTSVKSLLIRGADRRPGFPYPNRLWGYGTLNLYQSFLLTRE